jgi:hypothetical protein
MVLVHENDETVGHGELLVLELGHLEGLGRRECVGSMGDGCEGETEQQRCRERDFD